MADIGDKVPDIPVQKQLIHGQLWKNMVKGETWYLIDSTWFRKLKRYIGMDDSWEKVTSRDDYPGPIDNRSLLDDDGKLKEELVDEIDYILVPSETWKLLVEWYGTVDDNTEIPRQVVEYGVFVKHCKVEVYLLEVKLCKNFNFMKVKPYLLSKGDTIGDIEKVMRKMFDISDSERTRLWTCYSTNGFDELTKLDATVQDVGLYQNQSIVIETMSADGNWVHNIKKTAGTCSTTTTTTVTGADKRPLSTIEGPESASSGSGPGPSHTMSTRFNPYNYPVDSRAAPGLCGLCNLGNTCFMNSVLQCMSNCPPSTKYFLDNDHLDELNEENPLGMKGEIAKAFGDLLKTMWSGRHSYTMPHNFKLQVSRFAPQFSGYQQHDSQELLTFLLDGLHEDLNRIKHKPYIELQDGSGRPDEEVARESWENYKRRNDSMIVDFFHGLLKSTVVCPDCAKISITFDPFCYLSVPLPTKRDRVLEVVMFHYDSQKKPTRYTVTVPKNGRIRDLLASVGQLSGIPSAEMIVTEVSKGHFHKFFANNDSLDKVDDKDGIYIYEMPVRTETHTVVPIYLWESSQKHVFSYDQLFGDPLIVPVKRSHCIYNSLYDMVVTKLVQHLRQPDDNSSWWDRKSLDGEDDDRNSSDSGTDCKEELAERRLFSFYLISNTNDGNWELVKIHNDGNPLQLPGMEQMGQSFVAAKWSPEARKKFYCDKRLEDKEEEENLLPRTNFHSNLQALKLKDCIELFTTKERLGIDDAWYCPACKKHKQATKKFDLWSLPQILIIHLKRFVYNRLRRDKVDRLVQYPLQGLDLSEYMINRNEPPAIYDLIGVCNHYGGLGGGHYTAFCKNKNDSKWYLFDDNSVSEINDQAVVSNAAYVLFYMRRNYAGDCMELN